MALGLRSSFRLSEPIAIVLRISQPTDIPAWPQVLSIKTPRVEAALIDTQHFHANTDARWTNVLAPDRQADGIVPTVIQDTRENRKLDLVAHIREELALSRRAPVSYIVTRVRD